MGKSHKKKRKIEKRKNQANDFVVYKHPLSDVPRDVLDKGLLEIGKSNQEKFPPNLAKLVEIVHSYDGLLLIATLSVYGLFVGMSAAGKINPDDKDKRFNQSHVELVQAIALQIPEQTRPLNPPNPTKMQELFDLLPDSSYAFQLRHLTNYESDKSEEERAIRMLQSHLRLSTQMVRNWSYRQRVIAIMKRLFEPIDTLVKKHIGVQATELIYLFEKLSEEIEKRVNVRRNILKDVFSKPDAESVINAYFSANTQIKKESADIILHAKEKGLSLDQIKAIIFSHYDLSLSKELIFSSNVIAADTGLPEESLVKVLEKLSLRFGSLSGTDVEQLFLNNPVWTKPLISLGEKTYFLGLSNAFFSFIFPIFNELLKENDEIKSVYEKRRAQFLQKEIESLFLKAFPGCEIHAGYKWEEDTKSYENDLMVKVDSHLLLVEAKSQKISWSALRGAPDRARRHVKDLLFAPSEQSYRLSKRIYKFLEKEKNQSDLLPGFPFNLDEIKTVLRLSVTLEDFAILQSNIHMTREAGWFPNNHPIATCILLSDLEIVFDILESTPQKLHYLKRRSELEAHLKYMGDELDLLGFYLETGFNIGEVEFDGPHLQLTGMSNKVDEYYIALDEGIVRKKPQQKLSQWWRDILTRMESRSFHKWSDVTDIILGFSISEQIEAEKKFKHIRKNVSKNWWNKNHRNSIVLIPSESKSDALGFYAYRQRDKDLVKERMKSIASQVLSNPHVKRCAILGLNIDRQSYPYSDIIVFRGVHQNKCK